MNGEKKRERERERERERVCAKRGQIDNALNAFQYESETEISSKQKFQQTLSSEREKERESE